MDDLENNLSFKNSKTRQKVRIFLDWSIDMFFDRDIARLKVMREKPVEEFKELDEVDDVW